MRRWFQEWKLAFMTARAVWLNMEAEKLRRQAVLLNFSALRWEARALRHANEHGLQSLRDDIKDVIRKGMAP